MPGDSSPGMFLCHFLHQQGLELFLTVNFLKEAVEVTSKKVRITITGKNKIEALQEARKWVEQLEKEAREERRNIRTRGLILLGTILIDAVSDEEKRKGIYERSIEIDTLMKNPKISAEEKRTEKINAIKTVIALAKRLQEQLKKDLNLSQSNGTIEET
jgi:hypothetical protein